ncbi:MAG TPA: NAD(P)/FAD-dependent oxidoreductase [Chitinophagaceae bacterium]
MIGGGLAGLALSIQLAKAGHSVIVFEKEKYPFHRVCGEYISLESWNFLQGLGLDLSSIDPPIIKHLQVSAADGKLLQTRLPLGGFGISRYTLDFALATIARAAGVVIMENTKVNDVVAGDTTALIHTSTQTYKVKAAAGCFGKRSNIDSKWKRSFITSKKNKLNNYVGIKYHIQTDFAVDTIALHTFDHGYCGLVKIEGDKYNLCYLTSADNLQKSGGSITQMEQTILSQNPLLKKIFTNSEKLSKEPVTISQISFDKKSQVENHVLMIGDAAGMITPLCGNGMSMALHGSKIAAHQMDLFLKGAIGRDELEQLEQQYTRQWQHQFGSRLKMGRTIQRLSLNQGLMKFFISSGKLFPALLNPLIKKTHGKPF